MSIDSLYEGVIKKLTTEGKIIQISNKLLSLKTNDERVLYAYEIIESLNDFPPVQRVTKSKSVSVYYRNQGNKFYQISKNYEAWQYYNLSLLHAPTDSDHYLFALSNRSAVFYSLKKYADCLEDIKKVTADKYPDSLKEKLSKRQTACENELTKAKKTQKSDNTKSIDFLSFDGDKNTRYLCASSKLKVVFTEEMGRHVIANEDIKVGEILVQEDPYVALLLKSQYLFACSYCLSRNAHLMPCMHCCFAFYCSKQCEESAWKEYHSIECPLMPTLIYMEFTKLELLALRTVLKARSDYEDWQSFFNAIEDAELNLNNEFRGHSKIDDKWVFDSQNYATIHTLEHNVEKRSISDIFQKAVTAAVFCRLLSDTGDFMKWVDGEKQLENKIKRCVAGTLLLHVMTCPINMHGISTNVANDAGNYVQEMSIASAPYGFHSLLNHSCAPNVVRFNKLGTGTMTLFALRPIEKGMQIFDNYGSHHALEDRVSRHMQLKFQYKFTCHCEACEENWPTYLGLKPARYLTGHIRNNKEKLLSSHNIEKLQKGDKDTALKLFKPLCELAGNLEPYAPCVELADCQESLKQCLAILEGVLPTGYGNIIEWNPIPPKC